MPAKPQQHFVECKQSQLFIPLISRVDHIFDQCITELPCLFANGFRKPKKARVVRISAGLPTRWLRPNMELIVLLLSVVLVKSRDSNGVHCKRLSHSCCDILFCSIV